jgi:hypothetical protein
MSRPFRRRHGCRVGYVTTIEGEEILVDEDPGPSVPEANHRYLIIAVPDEEGRQFQQWYSPKELKEAGW